MAERLLAEFRSPSELAAAIRALRERGYRELEAYSPFSDSEIESAMGWKRSRLPWVVLVGGLIGAGGAYFVQWFTVAFLYPLNVGGRPAHFPLGFTIITFEMGVLFAALTAFISILVVGRLLRLVDGVQSADGFESASRDGFWLELSSADPGFDARRSRRELSDLGARRVVIPRDTT